MSRRPVLDADVFDYVMQIAKKRLPKADLDALLVKDVQGEDCIYNAPELL